MKNYSVLLASLTFSSLVFAGPVTHTESQSLFDAVSASMKSDNATVITKPATPTYHDKEKSNSFFHGVLAKQGVQQHLSFDKNTTIDYAPNQASQDSNGSLFRGALAK